MKVKVYPAVCSGAVRVPPSKSLAHRALLCTGLAEGTSRITGVSSSEDMAATCGALEALGAKVVRSGDCCTVSGCGGALFDLPETAIDCRESGSTLRFLIPLAALGRNPVHLTGHGRLMERSQSVYETLFAQQGLRFERQNSRITVQGPLHGGKIVLDGNVSSQFITGLLFSLPLLPEDSRIEILPPFQSRGYVDLTLDTLRQFGVQAAFDGEYSLVIPGGQCYQARDAVVEGDYSQAAFFAVLSALRGGIRLANLRRDSLQGDKAVFPILASFGSQTRWAEDTAEILSAHLTGQRIDVSNCPDLAPILSVLGLYSEGTTVLCNAARLRDKESDRIEAMETELRKLGAQVESTCDSLTIHGWGNRPAFRETEVSGRNDHRVVMSLAIAATLGSAPVVIDGAEAIAKSYPDFFDDLRRIGGRAEVLS